MSYWSGSQLPDQSAPDPRKCREQVQEWIEANRLDVPQTFACERVEITYQEVSVESTWESTVAAMKFRLAYGQVSRFPALTRELAYGNAPIRETLDTSESIATVGEGMALGPCNVALPQRIPLRVRVCLDVVGILPETEPTHCGSVCDTHTEASNWGIGSEHTLELDCGAFTFRLTYSIRCVEPLTLVLPVPEFVRRFAFVDYTAIEQDKLRRRCLQSAIVVAARNGLSADFVDECVVLRRSCA